jgi:hypothetical protein
MQGVPEDRRTINLGRRRQYPRPRGPALTLAQDLCQAKAQLPCHQLDGEIKSPNPAQILTARP